MRSIAAYIDTGARGQWVRGLPCVTAYEQVAFPAEKPDLAILQMSHARGALAWRACLALAERFIRVKIVAFSVSFFSPAKRHLIW